MALSRNWILSFDSTLSAIGYSPLSKPLMSPILNLTILEFGTVLT